MAYSKIRPRRGTYYEFSVTNPLLAEGEMVVEVPDDGVGSGLCKFKFGDGVNHYNDLPYAFDGSAANAINGGSPSTGNLIQLRAGTELQWEQADDPVLAVNEIIYVTGKGFKVGDGVHSFSELPYTSGASDYDDDNNEIYDFGDENEIVNAPAPGELTPESLNEVSHVYRVNVPYKIKIKSKALIDAGEDRIPQAEEIDTIYYVYDSEAGTYTEYKWNSEAGDWTETGVVLDQPPVDVNGATAYQEEILPEGWNENLIKNEANSGNS